MKRHRPRELTLDAFAAIHHWPEHIARDRDRATCGDDGDVMAYLGELLTCLPGRRRVRALELASLVEARLGTGQPGGDGLHRTLIDSLRSDHRCAFRIVPTPAPAPAGSPVLLAATPRSGNTLVQRLFAEVGGYSVVAAPTVADLEPDAIHGRVFIQCHAPADRHAHRFAAAIGARVVTVARHPLDVLLSVLHFSRHEPQILDWLDGAVLSPDSLRGASPTGDRFLRWAGRRGAARLLGITHRWWRESGVERIRYEELVADPGRVVDELFAALGVDADGEESRVAEVRETALAGLANHHRWRATPEGWRDLLTAEVAAQLGRRHQAVLDDLGYTVDADPSVPPLTESAARRNWEQLKR